MLKYLLLPVALLAFAFAAMSAQILVSTLQHRSAWAPTTATVEHVETQCELTYKAADEVLRQVAATGPCETIGETQLPPGGSRPRVSDHLYGSLVYVADGETRRWEGKLSDAGVYDVTAGAVVPLVFDPDDPSSLASSEMKGWLGGLMIILISGSFLVFYAWFFWLRKA